MFDPYPKFMQFRFPRSAGGGDLVMRVLSADDHDAVVDKMGNEAVRKVKKTTERLAMAAVYSIAGEAPPNTGPAAAIYFRKLGSKRRSFVLQAYTALHSLTDDEVRELRDSRVSVELEGGELGVQFTVPGTVKKDARGEEIEGSGDHFVMVELETGEIEDTVRGGLDGLSPLVASNMLVLASLRAYKGRPVTQGPAGLKELGACPNKVRTAFLMGYQSVHEADPEEVAPFIAAAVPMMEPPPAI